MSKGFRPGTLVRIRPDVDSDLDCAHLRGEITHIVKHSGFMDYWELALKSSSGRWVGVRECGLILIEDDGKQKTTWDQCQWRPNETRRQDKNKLTEVLRV